MDPLNLQRDNDLLGVDVMETTVLVASMPPPGLKPNEGWSPRGRSRLIAAELAVLRKHISADADRYAKFVALHTPKPALAVSQILFSWGLILAAWVVLVRCNPAFLPLVLPVALLVVGSRQRALSNAFHDAAHGTMVNGFNANRIVSHFLLAPALFEDFDVYRKSHLRHHAHLGDNLRDPDFLPMVLDEQGRPEGRPLQVYLKYLFNWKMWRISVFGTLFSMPRRWRIALFWAVLLGALAWISSPLQAGLFFAFWILARGTVHHAIRIFAEISDHVGLEPQGILPYTRNMPRNALSSFLHPHHDNFHLTHHLFPRVPLANLGPVHELLQGVKGYAEGHHCDSYFFGEQSVVQSWVQSSESDEAPVSSKRA